MATVILYRPVGPEELELIRESGFRRFPPRLPDQPIFYPVVQEEYARKIARDWNVPASGAGFVTRFEVDAAYWIPAEDLEDFNDHLVGVIEVIAEYPQTDTEHA